MLCAVCLEGTSEKNCMIRPLRSKRQHQGSRSVEPEALVTSRRRLGDVGAAPLLALVATHVDHFRRAAVVPLLRATPSVPASSECAVRNDTMKRSEERIERLAPAGRLHACVAVLSSGHERQLASARLHDRGLQQALIQRPCCYK